MLSLQKIFVFSLSTPWFFIQKFINIAQLFLRGGGGNWNLLSGMDAKKAGK